MKRLLLLLMLAMILLAVATPMTAQFEAGFLDSFWAPVAGFPVGTCGYWDGRYWGDGQFHPMPDTFCYAH